MNPTLRGILDGFLTRMQALPEVVGAWNFGSATHGLMDELSDADVVLLAEPGGFAGLEARVGEALAGLCSRVLLVWEEEFNSEAIVNDGYLLEAGGEVVQFDVFLLNAARLDDFMCRIHYRGLKPEDILYDPLGRVRALCGSVPPGEPWRAGVDRLERTYWYHVHMTAKYLLRKDFFKLAGVMHTLYETQASLLLTGYDESVWGGPANKLHALPAQKQAHLLRYGCTEDFDRNREALRAEMLWFEEDAREVCEKLGLPHDGSAAQAVTAWWQGMV